MILSVASRKAAALPVLLLAMHLYLWIAAIALLDEPGIGGGPASRGGVGTGPNGLPPQADADPKTDERKNAGSSHRKLEGRGGRMPQALLRLPGNDTAGDAIQPRQRTNGTDVSQNVEYQTGSLPRTRPPRAYRANVGRGGKQKKVTPAGQQASVIGGTIRGDPRQTSKTNLINARKQKLMTWRKRSRKKNDEPIDPFNCPFRTGPRRKLSQPDRCGGRPLGGEIIIKGERHSGTNWVRAIVQSNTCAKCDRDPEAGWKHGLFPPLGCGRPPSPNDVLVVVTRDAFTWLAKMMEETYDSNMNAKREGGFSAFIREGYRHDPSEELLRKCMTYNGADTPRVETADNMIRTRTTKYRQWLTENSAEIALRGNVSDGAGEAFLRNRIHLRMESLRSVGEGDSENVTATVREVQRALVGDPLYERCIPALVSDAFNEISSYTAWSKKKTLKMKKNFDPAGEREKLLGMYTKEDLRFVLSQLDLDFEMEIGYNYDYVRDFLQEGS